MAIVEEILQITCFFLFLFFLNIIHIFSITISYLRDYMEYFFFFNASHHNTI